MTGTLHENVFTFVIISRPVLPRMRNVSNKCCTEYQNTYFTFSNFFPKIVPFMRQCRKCGGTRGITNDATTWSMRVVRWVSKTTRTQTLRTRAPTRTYERSHTDQYVILIAFSRQQFLSERASVLRNTYFACLVSCKVINCSCISI
jgi:hypothetical protein